MIEINLLPDIKREYLRSQRVKHLFMLGAFIASGAAVGLVVVVWLFTVSQKVHLGHLDEDIDAGIKELQAVQDLDKVVTVQNQLGAIGGLNDQKPEASRVFDFLTLLTPKNINLGTVEVKFGEELPMIEITGVGKGFKEINQFVDTLKNAQFTHKDAPEPAPAFINVVLASSGTSTSSSEKEETAFKLTLGYDSQIFDNNLTDLKMQIPNITSTQSETQRPRALFDPNAQQDLNQGQPTNTGQ